MLSTLTGNPTDVEGNSASGSDIAFAAGGALVPVVAGSAIKKLGNKILKGGLKLYNKFANFSSAERGILDEASSFFGSEGFESIQKSFSKGKSGEFVINGRTVVLEPDAPISGMTLFDEGGFVIGREAFSSPEELKKTILHELHRLNTSNVGKTGKATQSTVTKETKNAASFADRAYNDIFN